MAPMQSMRTITKAYPPQLAVSDGTLNIYCPI